MRKLYFDLDQIQSRHARTTLNSGLAFGETAEAVDPDAAVRVVFSAIFLMQLSFTLLPLSP